MKLWLPFKNDPFMRTSFTWGLAVTCMIVIVQLMLTSLDTTPGFTTGERAIQEVITAVFTLFMCAYMVRFIGGKPLFYTAFCGFWVAFWLAIYGLVAEIIVNSEWSPRALLAAFITFVITLVIRAVPLAVIGAIGGWIVTRGRVPIEIEVPGKEDFKQAEAEGLPVPIARIITPLEKLPGNLESNRALIEQLDQDPASLLPEKEKKRRAKSNTRDGQ
jgi:hypothetical protein